MRCASRINIFWTFRVRETRALEMITFVEKSRQSQIVGRFFSLRSEETDVRGRLVRACTVSRNRLRHVRVFVIDLLSLIFFLSRTSYNTCRRLCRLFLNNSPDYACDDTRVHDQVTPVPVILSRDGNRFLLIDALFSLSYLFRKLFHYEFCRTRQIVLPVHILHRPGTTYA